MAGEFAKLFVTIGLDDKELQSSLNKVQKNLSQVGKVMTGIGAGITASLGLATKMAADEEKGIQRLSVALQNVGVEYDAVKGSLEAVINATQQKTSIADDQQRAALSELIATTGDYNTALSLLPLTMDLAIAKDMDMATAAELLGRVAMGNTSVLTRYGIQLKEGATATEALAAIQEKFGGQAEAYGQTVAGQFDLMKNNMGDFMESIGGQLLPILSELFKKIQPVIQSFIKWMEENPGLTKTIVIVAAAIGGVMVVLGPILMMLPAIAAGFTLMLGPVGLIIAAIIALVAIGTLLYLNWDKVVEFFKSIPAKIGDAFSRLKDIILAPFRAAWHGIGAGLNWLIDQINKIRVEIPAWVPGIGGKTFGIKLPSVTLPEFAAGGVVPGPLGQPVPVIAHGGERFLGVNKAASGGTVINIYPQNLVGTKEEIVRYIRESLLNEQGSNYSLGFS
jgi:phage-related minor tail protein